MTLLQRCIDHRRPLGDVGAAVEEAGHEQIALIGEAHGDARTLLGRDHTDGVAQHVVRHRRRLPRLYGVETRRIEALIRGSTLNDIWIVGRAATGGARVAIAGEASSAAPAAGAADAEGLSARAVEREAVLHAIHDRARVVDDARAQQRPDHLATPRLIDADAIR